MMDPCRILPVRARARAVPRWIHSSALARRVWPWVAGGRPRCKGVRHRNIAAPSRSGLRCLPELHLLDPGLVAPRTRNQPPPVPRARLKPSEHLQPSIVRLRHKIRRIRHRLPRPDRRNPCLQRKFTDVPSAAAIIPQREPIDRGRRTEVCDQCQATQSIKNLPRNFWGHGERERGGEEGVA